MWRSPLVTLPPHVAMYPPRRTATIIAVLPLLASAAGCYEYLPARGMHSLVGRSASLQLTDSGSVVLTQRIGARVDAVNGTFLGDSSSAYLMSVQSTHTRDMGDTGWKGERVAIPSLLVTSVQERQFSASRSMFAGALAMGGLVAATLALRGKGESGTGGTATGKAPGQ